MRSSTVLALATALVGAPAAASPLSDPTVGRAVFTGPVSPHPTSLEINPAALALGLPGGHLYLSGSGTLDQIGIDRTKLAIDGIGSGELSDASVSTVTGSWGMSASAWGVFPSGLVSSVGVAISTAPPETHPSGEEALRYHTLGGSYREVSVTVGGSIRLGDTVHIGAMFGLVPWSSLDLRFARDTALAQGREGLVATDPNGTPYGLENDATAERYRIRNAGAGLAFGADRIILSIGALVQVAPEWWIGLSYRSPQGLGSALTLSGDLEVVRSQRFLRDNPEEPASVDGNVDVRFDLPQTFHAGVRGRIAPELDLVGGLRFENLSRMSEYDVRPLGFTNVPEWLPRPRGFDNVYALNVGIEQVDTGQRLAAGGRLGVETAAVSAERISPMQVSGLVISADAGIQLRLLPALVVQLGYGIGYYPEVDSSNSAYDPGDMITCIDSGFNYDTDACAAVRGGYAIPTAAGSYRRLSHAARLGIRYDL